MNNNILEILNKMIKKIIKKKNNNIDNRKILEEFQKDGYEVSDIEKALKLFKHTTDFKTDPEYNKRNNTKFYNRVFTRAEKLYLPLNLQGLIQRLVILKVLTPEESETLITQLVNTSYRGTLKTSDIWDLLEKIIEDETKLNIISQEIPEFKDYYSRNYKYIN